jgi:hypothetical protein
VYRHYCTIDCLFDVDSCNFVWASDKLDPNGRLCALWEGSVGFVGELCDVTIQYPPLRSIVSTLLSRRPPLITEPIGSSRTYRRFERRS